MKMYSLFSYAAAAAALSASALLGAELKVKKPVLDPAGKFWIYGAGLKNDPPFTPYAWMPANAGDFLAMDLYAHPPGTGETGPASIEFKVQWKPPHWCAVA